MSVYESLYTRIPAGKAGGQAIRGTLARGLELKDAVKTAASRDELNAKGRAALVEKHIKTSAGPALAKARRQLAHYDRAIERKRALVTAKAIGEAKSTDAEWRTYLRSLPTHERIQEVLNNPAARGAALRELGLSGLSGDTFAETVARAMDIAIKENAAIESAALVAAEEVRSLHNAAVTVLTREILETAFITEPSGAVRKLSSPLELEKYLAKEVPAVPPYAVMHEEIEADAVEDV